MGKGKTKGRKGHKGKPRSKGQKGRSHREEAWRHAQEINARRRAEGKDARSTASITQSQLRAQQQLRPSLAESSRARSRSPLGQRVSSCSPTADDAPGSYSYCEESEEESAGPGGPEPRVDPRRPTTDTKPSGEFP